MISEWNKFDPDEMLTIISYIARIYFNFLRGDSKSMLLKQGKKGDSDKK